MVVKKGDRAFCYGNAFEQSVSIAEGAVGDGDRWNAVALDCSVEVEEARVSHESIKLDFGDFTFCNEPAFCLSFYLAHRNAGSSFEKLKSLRSDVKHCDVGHNFFHTVDTGERERTSFEQLRFAFCVGV